MFGCAGRLKTLATGGEEGPIAGASSTRIYFKLCEPTTERLCEGAVGGARGILKE